MASVGPLSTSSLSSKPRISSLRSRSHESLQALEHATRKAPELAIAKKQAGPTRAQEMFRAKPVSRLELLLLAKKPTPIYIPEEETTASHKANQAIKACTEWSQLQQTVDSSPDLTSSNLAFAVYRLGCLQAFASKKRIADLEASSFVPLLVEKAMTKLEDMEPASLVLFLDGCARLQHQPSCSEFSRIATSVQQNVYSMYARQLPLVLWAFSSLHYDPGSQVLLSLEDAVNRQAAELSPQGMALVLSSFNSAKHQLSDLTLNRLADVILRKLLLFKPSELATCLKALSVQGYEPPPAFLKAILERNGEAADYDHAARAPVGTVPHLAYMM